MTQGTSVVQVQLGDRSYPIHIGAGAWNILEKQLVGWTGMGKCMLVTDEKVYSIYSERINAMARMMETSAEVYITPEGESSKSFERLEDLCRTMAQLGLDRDSLIVP